MLPATHAQLQCEFFVAGCSHDQCQLFSSAFARSCVASRTAVPSIAAGVTVADRSTKQSLHKVVVYGRFEREEPDQRSDPVEQLQLGQQVPSTSITSSKQQNLWIQAQAGSAVEIKQLSSQVFAFQNDEQCHWEYDWYSGTSQRQRAQTHVFRTYAFLPVAATAQATTMNRKAKSRSSKKKVSATTGKDTTWQVVGIITSTPFTISAYRKPTEPEQQASAVIHGQRREVIQVDDDDSDETETDPELENPSETTTASHLLLPSDFRKLIWEKRNPMVVKATTSLSIFALFVSQIQLKWLSPYMISRALLPLLRFWRVPGPGRPAMDQDFYSYASVDGGDNDYNNSSNSNGNDQDRLLLHYINYCAPRLVAVLTANAADTSHNNHSYSGRYEVSNNGEEGDENNDLDESMAQLSSLAEQCFDLVCSLLENDQWNLIERFVRNEATSSKAPSDENSGREDSSKANEAVYARFVSLLTHLLNETLTNDAVKLGLVVDNIVSSVYKDRKASESAAFAPFVLEQVGSLLRNTNALGIELFQAQVRVVESSHEHRSFDDAHRSLGFPSPQSDFTGRWVCRTIEASQQHLNPNHQIKVFDFHAVPAILALLYTFGFDLELLQASSYDEGSATQLSVHSLVSLFPEVGVCFTLDDEYHSLDRLPCGMSAEWLLQLAFVGESSTSSSEWNIEYRGSTAPSDSNGVIHLDVYLHPGADDGVRVSLAIQLLQLKHQQKRSFSLQRKSQAISSHATRTRLQVKATLSRGHCDRNNISGDVTPHERLERIKDWQEQLGFTAMYDRHVSHSPMGNFADRMTRTQAPTAFTISREDEGRGELSAIV